MATKIFLSYRRDDSSGYTALLYKRLSGHYGPAAVFRDVHAIHPIDRFRDVIALALVDCAVVLVVMSKQWVRIAAPDGVVRLHKPDDVVCWEIESALARSVPVLPVLVGGAKMPSADDLPEGIRRLADITALEMSDQRWEDDFESLVATINKVAQVMAPPIAGINPFSMRGGIREDTFFYNRERERRTLRDYLRGKQNCQLVGQRRIGKSSVLLYAQRHCVEWCESARIAYLDLQDPHCYTFAGWLKAIASGLGVRQQLHTLSDLVDAIDDLIAQGIQPVLCLDEFGEMTRRTSEFTREVYLTLRSCGQRGTSILTAAPKRMSELTDPRDNSSPFFNTFPMLPVREFLPKDARAYVTLDRDGVPPFTAHEIERILEFAQGHPLALQAACFHVVATRESGDDLLAAIARAREDCGLR